jgi:NADH-quinone oxidoreductase subunit G
VFNTTIEGIEKADVCLLIGTNPRHEASLINARLRKRFLKGGFTIASIGKTAELTYPVLQLGDSLTALEDIVNGTHSFSETLKNASNPMIIIGQDALTRRDGEAVLALCHRLAENYSLVKEGWNGFNVLHQAAARVGGLDIGFVPGTNGLDTAAILEGAASGAIEVVYLLGADEINMESLGNTFVIYQGHHGDAGAHRADVILPGAAYTEKNGTYVNTEGRVQRSHAAVPPPGEAREDWKIIATLAEFMAKPLSYSSLSGIRKRLVEVAPHFASIGAVTPNAWQNFGKYGALAADPLQGETGNYYMTNPISRASRIMAQCSSVAASANGEAA